MKILIADDHAVVRGGLRQFLADVTDWRVLGEAATGRQALDKVQAEHWDLLLLDIGLPDMDGLEVLRRVKQVRPELPVLVFSMFAEDDYALRVHEAGAAGYLPKDSTPREIIAAIRRVASGERYLSPELTDKLLAGTARAGKRQPHELLSAREMEVLRRLGNGAALIDIAEALHLSPKTVSTYRARVLEKLELNTNADLTRYLIEHKLTG